MPVVRARPGRRLQARRRGHRRARRPGGAAAGRGHGLRGQRAGGGPRGRSRRRVGQRQGADLRQGRGHQDRARARDRRDPDRGGHEARRGRWSPRARSPPSPSAERRRDAGESQHALVDPPQQAGGLQEVVPQPAARRSGRPTPRPRRSSSSAEHRGRLVPGAVQRVEVGPYPVDRGLPAPRPSRERGRRRRGGRGHGRSGRCRRARAARRGSSSDGAAPRAGQRGGPVAQRAQRVVHVAGQLDRRAATVRGRGAGPSAAARTASAALHEVVVGPRRRPSRVRRRQHQERRRACPSPRRPPSPRSAAQGLQAELADQAVHQCEHRGDPERHQRLRDRAPGRARGTGSRRARATVGIDRPPSTTASAMPAATPPTVPSTRCQPRLSTSPRLLVPAKTTKAATVAQYQREGETSSPTTIDSATRRRPAGPGGCSGAAPAGTRRRRPSWRRVRVASGPRGGIVAGGRPAVGIRPPSTAAAATYCGPATASASASRCTANATRCVRSRVPAGLLGQRHRVHGAPRPAARAPSRAASRSRSRRRARAGRPAGRRGRRRAGRRPSRAGGSRSPAARRPARRPAPVARGPSGSALSASRRAAIPRRCQPVEPVGHQQRGRVEPGAPSPCVPQRRVHPVGRSARRPPAARRPRPRGRARVPGTRAAGGSASGRPARRTRSRAGAASHPARPTAATSSHGSSAGRAWRNWVKK